MPKTNDPAHWAGVYWLQPANNFGNVPGGYDLRGYSQVQFRARSTTDGAPVKFLVGG